MTITAYEKFKAKMAAYAHAAKPPATCWLFHRWGRWVQYDQGLQRWMSVDHKWHDVSEIRQRRLCNRCGRMQDQKVAAA